MSKEATFILRVEGGTADEGLLDAYDAADMILGLARATNLIAHAFCNDEAVRTKNQSAHGAKTFAHPNKKGCFEQQITIVFDDEIVNKIGHSVIINIFWDYMVWAWSYGIGSDYSPVTPYVKKIEADEDKSEFIYAISNRLENSLQAIHRAISRDRRVVIYLNRPRVSDVLMLNADSLDYVSTTNEGVEQDYIVANVTRFNVINSFGRLFSDEEDRVISFEMADEHDRRVRDLALKSMQQYADAGGKMNMKVSRIVNARGFVKRYVVHDILEIHN
ncbi:hypothetical protein [Chromobacterium violaceum]|uniref:DUF7946 domain-containing protein n=1 Tax=Chromobacterium violaceum TaxID=536 RepID=UPI00111C61E0|nr:hypothetical protein [Chromobacterium violaceum]